MVCGQTHKCDPDELPQGVTLSLLSALAGYIGGSSSSGLARDIDVACHQGDAPQPARADDVACQQDDAPHLDRASNVVQALLRGVHSPQRAADISPCAQALLRATRTPDISSTSHAGSEIEKQIRQFWDDRGDEGVKLLQETKHLRTLLFRKKKHPVSQDLWFPGGSHSGEEQHVEAVVSDTFVLKQLKEVIECRETWLRQEGLPMDCQMRDGIERREFLDWAKNKYHAEAYQQQLQQRDLEKGTNVQKGKKQRWDRELQRRLGTSALWQMVRVIR